MLHCKSIIIQYKIKNFISVAYQDPVNLPHCNPKTCNPCGENFLKLSKSLSSRKC